MGGENQSGFFVCLSGVHGEYRKSGLDVPIIGRGAIENPHWFRPLFENHGSKIDNIHGSGTHPGFGLPARFEQNENLVIAGEMNLLCR